MFSFKVRFATCFFSFFLTFFPYLASAKTSDKTVILVSIDGMRWDYIKRHKASYLSSLAETGFSAEKLQPIFPSKTFPNHYTIVTGLYAEEHGIVGNHFYDGQREESFLLKKRSAVEDGSWYGGEPIWITAKKQGLRTACFFWPGSEAAIMGMRPDIYKVYDESITQKERVDRVLSWLEKKDRPHFITLYFSKVDSMGHKYGPLSSETAKAVEKVDGMLKRLHKGVEKRGLADKVDLVVVSDHGMAQTSKDRVIDFASFFDSSQFSKTLFSSTMMMLWPKDAKKPLYKKSAFFDVYPRKAIPARYRFQKNHRISPYVAIARPGYVFRKEGSKKKKLLAGTHGYDNRHPDMAGILIGHGPSFKRQKIGVAENIDIYNLLSHLLAIKPAKNSGSNKLVGLVKKQNDMRL